MPQPLPGEGLETVVGQGFISMPQLGGEDGLDAAALLWEGS